MKEWIDSVPDTNTLFELEEYDIISKKVNDWINGDDNSASDGTSRNFDTSAKTTSKSEDSAFKSLDDAFSSLS